MQYKKIENLEDLKQKAKNVSLECFISLAEGSARSSKVITYYPETDRFWVWNEIDDTEQNLKSKNLGRYTNIVEALDKGCLWQYI
jgi:hypothetical protein